MQGRVHQCGFREHPREEEEDEEMKEKEPHSPRTWSRLFLALLYSRSSLFRPSLPIALAMRLDYISRRYLGANEYAIH